ncbi:MAG: SpoIIE family protein phosphatase [Acidobacteria bacterium]|nr:SpoIIE family protein phosphatase [Acidobacteriota bacterium]
MAKTSPRSKSASTPAVEPGPPDFVDEVESLGEELCGLRDPKAVMKALARRLVDRYGTSVCGVWLINRKKSTLELVAEAGEPGIPTGLARLAYEETLLGKAVRQRLPQVAPRTDGEGDALVDWARENDLGFVAAYPLAGDADAQGAFLIGCAKSPSKSSLGLFRLHAMIASLALRDAELFSSTQGILSKLSFLMEASQALNSTLDLSELLGRILEVAKTQVNAERGTLFLVDDKTNEIWSLIAHGLGKQEIRLPLGKGIAGHVAKTGETVIIPDAYADPRFNPEVDKRTGYHTRSILCLAILNKAGKIIAALQLLNKKDGTFSEEDAEFLRTLSGHMAVALENAQLHQALLEKERMEKELALARGIQKSLLPDTAPLVKGFDIALLNEPCYAVGGDYYDFLTLGPNTLLVVIADVEGKGVGSALVMSNLQATLRALVVHLHSLDEIAESLNRMILNDTRSQKYLSIFMGLIDTRRKGLHYINCGHVPPVIVRPKNEPITLTEGGMVIGLFENAQYRRGHIKLQSGDVLVLCTDGITESMDSHSDEYGDERLLECVHQSADLKAAEIVEAVSADVARHSRHGTHLDDKVMIAIKVG